MLQFLMYPFCSRRGDSLVVGGGGLEDYIQYFFVRDKWILNCQSDSFVLLYVHFFFSFRYFHYQLSYA